MANEDLIRPKRTPVGHRNGGWVIHFPQWSVPARPALATAYDLFWCFCAFSCAFRRSLIALRCPRVWSVSENSSVWCHISANVRSNGRGSNLPSFVCPTSTALPSNRLRLRRPMAFRYIDRPRRPRRRSRLPRKTWRLEGRSQEGNTLHTFPLPHLRNRTVSVPRSQAVLAPLAMSVTASPRSA